MSGLRRRSLVVVATLLLTATTWPSGAAVTVTVTEDVVAEDVRRFGINIGARTWWGASQILANLLDNPGFEAGTFASTAPLLGGATSTRVQLDGWDTSWNNDLLGIGQPAGMWTGGTVEFVTGPAAGQTRTVSSHTFEVHPGPPPVTRHTLYLDAPVPVPDPSDIVVLRRTMDLPTRTYGALGDVATSPDPATTRPGSPGQQSLRIHAHPTGANGAQLRYFFDSLWRDGDPTAGKLLVIDGSYRLSFWAKGSNGDTLDVTFARDGQTPFLDTQVLLTDEWERYDLDFDVPAGTDAFPPSPSETPALLYLDFRRIGADDAWIDDAWFGRAATQQDTYAPSLVERLRELRPGTLRYWGGQHGTTLADQLAQPWARRTSGWSMAQREATDFHHGLHEFLDLARTVGADPWYVVPTAFGDDEWADLIAYLAAPPGMHPMADLRAQLGQPEPWTSVFRDIHLELGNEMWNTVFFGAWVGSFENIAAFAEARFGAARSTPHFDPAIRLVAGSQDAVPFGTGQVGALSPSSDVVAVAPYFGILEDRASAPDIYYPVFADALHRISASGTLGDARARLPAAAELAVYEINYHTTDACDGAPAALRSTFVAGTASALALPFHLLVNQRDLGIAVQNAFTATQWGYPMQPCPPFAGGYVPLWGLLRDLEATERKRPGWLGMEAVNRIVQGDAVATVQSPGPVWTAAADVNGIPQGTALDLVQSFAFEEGDTRGLVLMNLHVSTPQPVRIEFPRTPAAQGTHHRVTGSALDSDNEDREGVVLQSSSLPLAQGMQLTLPPMSLHVIEWTVATDEDPTEEPPGGDGDDTSGGEDEAGPEGPGPSDGASPTRDGDGDGVADDADNCPGHANQDQSDQDGDGVGDACGIRVEDGGQGASQGAVHDTWQRDGVGGLLHCGGVDADRDGTPDACDADIDGDGIPQHEGDNCPLLPNDGQQDVDGDGVGDVCDGSGFAGNEERPEGFHPPGTHAGPVHDAAAEPSIGFAVLVLCAVMALALRPRQAKGT